MFDNFTLIPHTDSEASIMMEPMNEITEKFQALVPCKAYDIRWFGNYILISIANLLAVMSGLTADPENKSLTKYYENDDYNFKNDYATEEGLGMIRKLCDILGIITEIKKEKLDSEIEALIEERQAARKAKNFARADEIRDLLAAEGIILEDTREGVKWKRA